MIFFQNTVILWNILEDEMKTRWYKSGKALLGQISASEPPADTALIWYMGQHGFALNLEGTVFYIDVILNALCGKD